MPLLRDERGSALTAALMLLTVMLMLGLAFHAQADTEQRQSGAQRVNESTLGVSEAALNAQVFKLAAGGIPSPSAPTTAPGTCGAGVTVPATAQPNCPTDASLASYAGGDYAATCNGTAPNRWRTSIRDNGGGAESYYNATIVNSQPTTDENKDGAVWVRADGAAACKQRSIVTLVKAADQILTLPNNVVTANGFRTTNNGRKVIVDTDGDDANPGQPAPVSLRCAGMPNPLVCAQYERGKDQLAPDTLVAPDPTAPLKAISDADLLLLEQKARSLGTYFGPGVCPTSLSGKVVYVETLAATCNVSRAANSKTAPGMLVVVNGTFEIGGNSEFWGVVYMRNAQNSSGAVVTLGGTSAIHGAVHIDGPGTVDAGSSKANIVYDPRAASLAIGLGTAAAVPGTWRELRRGE